MNTITNVSVNTIFNHVNNPRKDLGDLSELAESIKKNGILQPLTVVPENEMYKVVIGHRRLEAARQAGLEEVPCIVEELGEDAQLNVMMMENMMRENLTTYEEAKGFQLMLDLGKSVEEVAGETGFSQSTIRNRTKLLGLNEKEFKKSVERGATLGDLVKLYDIQDDKTRDAVLKTAGTKDFDSKLNAAVENERRERAFAEAKEKLASFAMKVDSKDEITEYIPAFKYFANVSYWNPKVPEPVEGLRYFWKDDDRSVYVWVEGNPEEDEAEKERVARERAIRDELEAAKESVYNLRVNFIKNFGNFRKYGKTILRRFAETAINPKGGWYRDKYLCELFGVDSIEKIPEASADYPVEKIALYYLEASLDSPATTWRCDYNGGNSRYIYQPNDALMNWYSFLVEIGYQPSQEEIDFMNGDVNNVIKEEAA